MSPGSGSVPRWVLGTCVALLVVASMELMSRGFWMLMAGVGPLDSRAVEHAFYRELRKAEHASPQRGDGVVDVLLLGGSVLTHAYGDVHAELKRALAERLDRPYELYSMARSGLTSRDSLLKYRLLEDERFDAVFFYHGINELRANNAPPARFRSDYGHMSWYRKTNLVMAHPTLARWFTLPFTVHVGAIAAAEAMGFLPAIGIRRPRPEYLEYGADLKSVVPFERNVREVVEIARGRGDPLILASFAFYVPEGYSLAAFEAHALDYRYFGNSVPLEVWGLPENVVAGLEAHNRVLRSLRPEVPRFLDLEAAIPKQGRYWRDPCHLASDGARLLAGSVADAVASLVGGPPPPAS